MSTHAIAGENRTHPLVGAVSSFASEIARLPVLWAMAASLVFALVLALCALALPLLVAVLKLHDLGVELVNEAKSLLHPSATGDDPDADH